MRSRFGDGIAVLHSGLSPAERAAQWRKVRAGETALCVGARSAVFSPFPDLGLIVIDEEQDAAYKQEEGVRYQARDLALLRGRMERAVVLMGSATPSAEAWHMAHAGGATLLSLPERIGRSRLPEIRVVDIKEQNYRRGADRYFSPELIAAVDETLARGEKTMLFLNRRGFASALTCLDCGTTVQCPNCQVSMTWHKEIDALLCHYCNVKRGEPETCGKCGGHKLAQMGIGTERLFSWVARRWKEARVARLDSDVTRRRGAYAEVLSGMQRGDVDILVGTQMIAKGHDFPEVTLVGVLLADLSMAFPDFRSSERTFQILTQISGRAGRGDLPGKVILQTLSPESHCHPQGGGARLRRVHEGGARRAGGDGVPPLRPDADAAPVRGASGRRARGGGRDGPGAVPARWPGRGSGSWAPRLRRSRGSSAGSTTRSCCSPPRGSPSANRFPELLRSLREKVRKTGDPPRSRRRPVPDDGVTPGWHGA